MSNFLDDITYPSDLRKLKLEDLPKVCAELRSKTIDIVSQTGGHLGAGLGVVELTVALHYVFDTPNDRIIWDIGHQTYPHKIITGRKDKMHTLRQANGLSGFTKITESEYDHFGAGHCSTSISAAFGMAVARDLKQEKNNVIAVIGDGSMSAGMAYEALNNAGASNNKMIVILNNNDMSIARPVGALSRYLSKITSSKSYRVFRSVAKQALEHLPESLEKMIKKTEQYIKNFGSSNDIFDDLGFYSIGPVDGHNVIELVSILNKIKDDQEVTSPFLLHIITEKGRGFNPNKKCPEKFHAVSKFDPDTLEPHPNISSFLSYTKVFAETLAKLAENDKRIVAITAAMPSGTGLSVFTKKFSERMFDVGIAEQHAVTFGAGLAYEGFKPFVAIYSTFLQRAYDQVVHDVAIQNLPVRLAIDRAGLVGADGPTHAGSFDITYLATLPNMVVMAASNGQELASMVKTAAEYNKGPLAFRYPRGDCELTALPQQIDILSIGKGKYIQEAAANSKFKIAIVSLGTSTNEAIKAAANFANYSQLGFTIFDARFAKPIDQENILNIARTHQIMLTIEEGAIGGFAAQVTKLLQDHAIFDQGKLIFRSLFLPDEYIDQDIYQNMLKQAGLDSEGIIKLIKQLLPKEYVISQAS